MADGFLSDHERDLWREIELNYGEVAEEPAGLPSAPLHRRAQALWRRAMERLDGQPGSLSNPFPDSAPKPQPVEARPGDGKRDVIMALAIILAAGAIVGIGRWARSESEQGEPQPVAFSDASQEDQLAARRMILGSEILLLRTGTCAEELNAAADGAWGGEPSREELFKGAALAKQIGALCFPDETVGSQFVVRLENGKVIAIDGNTAPGERNSAEALCNPAGLASLDERFGALPSGSIEQGHVDALRGIVQDNC
jgi:hypothetical protein